MKKTSSSETIESILQPRISSQNRVRLNEFTNCADKTLHAKQQKLQREQRYEPNPAIAGISSATPVPIR